MCRGGDERGKGWSKRVEENLEEGKGEEKSWKGTKKNEQDEDNV